MGERLTGNIINAMDPDNIVTYIVDNPDLFEEGMALSVHSPSINHTKKIKKFFAKLEDVHCPKTTDLLKITGITLMFD